jgi:Zn-dependent M28 family amino/carboxypeptidase
MEISVGIRKYKDYTSNVVAYVEGSDPVLKNEYVLFGSHHDHVGAREGRIYNGADDNGSGTVAMLELAQAVMLEKPRRSVIFVWHTAEEKGLWGSNYFVANSPVPVEKMSAELNMDMLCRNDPDSIYLIGSNKLSTDLDAAIHSMNDKHIHLNLDYKYEATDHPDMFFFRSDQYTYIRYGIPSVWFFCGTTEDYHQETDTIEKVDFKKMERVTKLVYLTALEIANKEHMLPLDIHPEVKTRGKHNLKVNWKKRPPKK